MAIKIVDSGIVDNLNRAIKNMNLSTVSSISKIATKIKEKSISKSPVDTGNMQASHYISVGKFNDQIIAEIGNTAEYSPYVHENLESKHPVGTAKFLEKAVEEISPTILNSIKAGMKIE